MSQVAIVRRASARAPLALLVCALLTCGEPTRPEPQYIGTIIIGVDSVVVVANDTARIPVTVRDTRGTPMTLPSLAWTIDNPAIASVGESGVVRGLRSGRAFARAERDGVRDSVRVVVTFDVVITPGDPQITAIGDTVSLTAEARDASGTVATSFVWQSRSSTIARIAQTGRVTAVAPGTTWIIAAEQGGSLDSARITVGQRVVSIVLTPGDTTRPLLRTQRFIARAFDAGGTLIDGVRFAWRSTDPSIATVDTGGLSTAMAVGVDTIVATAEGVSARAALRVSRLPRLFFNRDTLLVAAGQTPLGYDRPMPSLSAESVEAEETVVVTIDVSDTNVVSAPSIVDVPVRTTASRVFTISGRSAGIARLVARAPRYDSAVASVRVTSPRLVVSPTGPLRMAMNEHFHTFVVTADSLGASARVLDSTWIRALPVTPGIVRPVRDTFPVPRGDAGTTVGFIPLAPGRTWVHYESPGYRPDSADIEVVPSRLQFTHPNLAPLGAESSIGVGQINGWNSVLISIGASTYQDSVTVTLSQAHPEVLRLSSTEMLIKTPSGYPWAWVPWTGLAAGVDTVIASATGYAPDTMIVRVTRPHVRLAEVPSTAHTTNTMRLRLYAADSLGNVHYPVNAPVRLSVSSSDPSILAVESDSALIGGSTGGGEYRTVPVGIGVATLTFSDPTGLYAPVTSAPITVAPSRIWFGADGQHKPAVDIGMGQRMRYPAAHVTVDNYGFADVYVHVQSRNPRLAWPDPEEPLVEKSSGASAHYDIHAGDTTGTTWFVFTGRGLITDSLFVRVGRPIMVVTGPGTMFERDSSAIRVSLRDHAGNARVTREALRLRLTSTNTTVLQPDVDTVTVAAGEYESPSVRIRSLGTGVASILVEDVRTGYQRYESGASPIVTVKIRPEPAAPPE